MHLIRAFEEEMKPTLYPTEPIIWEISQTFQQKFQNFYEIFSQKIDSGV